MTRTPASKREIDKARWPQLSPLLDELLDLDEPAARAARLAQLRAQDLALAEDLEELLARDAAMARAPVLDSPVLAQLAQVPILKPGQQLGPYTLEREIGQGGMGTVWLARRTDGRYEGQVAVKFLTSGLLGRGDGGRFAREGQILGRLAHPHIARLLDAGVAQDGGPPYLVLEYIDGQPIDRFCEQQALDVRARVTLFLDVLAAVAHAHNRLILHRDLKPSNILVNQAGEVKLLDFGIAKLLGDTTQAEQGAAATELTQQAGRAFTPQYAAPEQVQGGDHYVTTATDVYALGVLLYLLLSGQHPTSGALTDDSPLARMKAVLEVEPRRLSDQVRAQDDGNHKRARELRGDLDTIVAKALKKAPGERYANAEAMAADLQRWLVHEPILARPDSAGYRVAKFVRRHRVGVAAGAAAVLALSSLTILSVAQAWRAERAEKLAQQRSAQADDLLAYMLGEFADKLRPIGRLELLDNVGSKALSHLAAKKNQTSPLERLQRAKALTVVGEVRVSKRELDAAIEPLEQANALMLDEQPGPELLPAWRKAQGAAAFWLGHVYYTQRSFPLALQAWTRYQDVSAQWLKARPLDLDAQAELSYAKNSLGSLLMDQGQLPAAELAFRRSVELKEQVLKERPLDTTLRAEWSDSLTWLGSTLVQTGRYSEAQSVFQRALRQAQDLLAKQPADQGRLEEVGNAAHALADAMWRDGQARAASSNFAVAIDAFRTLSTLDPGNRKSAYSLIRAEAGALRGQPSKLAAVVDLQRRLVALEAGRTPSPRWHPLRAELALLQASALLQQQHERGLAAAKTLVAETLAMLQTDRVKHPADLKLSTATLELALFQAEALSASPVERQARCTSVWAESHSPVLAGLLREHAGLTGLAARALNCLGRADEARALQQWLDAQRRWTPSQPQPAS